MRDLSKLCVVKEASNQGPRGSHSLDWRVEELSGTNVQEKVWKMMREIRYVVIGMSHQKDQSVVQGMPYDRVSFCKVVLEYHMKVRRFFQYSSVSIRSRGCDHLHIDSYSYDQCDPIGHSKVISVEISDKVKNPFVTGIAMQLASERVQPTLKLNFNLALDAYNDRSDFLFFIYEDPSKTR